MHATDRPTVPAPAAGPVGPAGPVCPAAGALPRESAPEAARGLVRGPVRGLVRGPARPGVAGWPDARTDTLEEVGRRIGADHARLGVTPPPEHLHPGNPVGAGWRRALPRWRPLRGVADDATRLWLQLRLACWLEGRIFDGLSITPRTLAGLNGGRCPVTRRSFSEDDDAPWPIVLFEGAACAAGNVALVGRAVALQPSALDAAQHRRLASLRALATPMSHEQAASSVLHLFAPRRCRVINPAHALQTLLMMSVAGPSPNGVPQVQDIASSLPQAARRACCQLASALLACRLGAQSELSPTGSLDALEDAWAEPRVGALWARLMQALDPQACERALRSLASRAALQHSSGAAGWRWLEDDAATEGWALEQAGRLQILGAGSPATAVPLAQSLKS